MLAVFKRHKAAFWTFFLSLALCTTGVVTPVWAGDGHGYGHKGARVVAPGHTLFGKSYNELTGKWWNWGLAEAEMNAIGDPDGSYCALNQRGKVWFLAGTFGGVAQRSCHVPDGKAVFFPILSGLSWAPDFLDACGDDPALGLSEVDKIRCDVNDDIPVAPDVALQVIIDGKPVEDLYAYRTQSQPGGFALKALFGALDSPLRPAVADGYWILLRPLSHGVHTVSFGADLDLDGTLDLGADYTLYVGHRRGHNRY